ncbi:MAG: rRNA maturation RNase YbeY [Bacteroidales bacterium]|nr:rRNA maturation RNase YbeY [Bacteroidales bacterium]
MVRFFTEDIPFSLPERLRCRRWCKLAAGQEQRRLGNVNFIFCSDARLLDINRQFLQHNYYTDVITFDYCEGDILSGDIFISIDTVRENAAAFHATFENELHRVMIHGLLHLVGYDDHTEAQQRRMHEKEDHYLALWEHVAGSHAKTL